MNPTEILQTDKLAREIALDSTQSFIVQAPAGSGKTGLLIQRFLTLLGSVEVPEEVLAITFTRKAAGEMRERVLSALSKAGIEPEPENEHDRRTWLLAKSVLRRDDEKNWHIQENPLRLRMQTIDSLCSSLTRQMPVLSNFGAQPGVTEDPSALYIEAARGTLALLESGNSWSESVRRLLTYLDNNLQTVEGLLAAMLARRDQWLRHIAVHSDERIQRESLETALETVVCEALDKLHAAITDEVGSELVEVLRYAAGNLNEAEASSSSEVLHSLDCTELPGNTPDDLPAWRGVVQLLLTNEGSWRKRLDASIGMLPPSKVTDKTEKARRQLMKDRLDVLIARMAESEFLQDQLDGLRTLPPVKYEESQWQVMEALFEMLPLAVAQLRLAFLAQGQVDFTEVSQSAIRALGEEDNPTDLALALDYRIRHLLVDEFQDTSLSQYALLSKLTAGWEEGDGRTMFVVGDPMQSIYRFREAEVGLYLRARHEGIGTIYLKPVTLSVNFRSQQGIVEWVNNTFAAVFPQREDIASGAVSYSESIAHKHDLGVPAVVVHPFFNKDHISEAIKVVELVKAAKVSDSAAKVAILVRNRSHLVEIIPALKEAGLRFRAIEIEQLGTLPIIQDLLSLTRALSHPADRLAWLAVLRAPWCGLTLADLHVLAGEDHRSTLWDLMQQEAVFTRMSQDGQQRLSRIRSVMFDAISQRQRLPLRRWIEGVWLALGGPAAVKDETALEDANVFFDVLEKFNTGGNLADFSGLADRVAKLFALPDVQADDTVQIMTIHKSKGLEFETVILPGLGRTPRTSESQLLIWAERPTEHGQSDLLLAPIKATGSNDTITSVYTYLQLLNKRRGKNEDGRLLYVACTRAKHHLHLLGCATAKLKKEIVEVTVSSNSLLNQLWPVVGSLFTSAASDLAGKLAEEAENEAGLLPIIFSSKIQRLNSGWVLPPPPLAVQWAESEQRAEEALVAQVEVEFEWASETAKFIGIVVHKWLQKIAQEGAQVWNLARVENLRNSFANTLLNLGVPRNELPDAVDKTVQALSLTLSNQRGSWVLDSRHHDSQAEYALTGIYCDELVNIIIDRSFVDDQGVRWIIDYKTSTHEGGDLEGFLDNEQLRYRGQLERYAALISHLDDRPIRLGLYFPVLGGWREWGYEGN